MVATRLGWPNVAVWREPRIVIREAVERYYLQQWGKPSRTATFRSADATIEVYKWNADSTREGVAIYATVGASLYPIKDTPSDHRVEFFVGLNPERDEIASPLAALASYPIAHNVTIGHGHTVPLDKPLWVGSGMSSLMVLRPVSTVIGQLHLSGGLHVEFLQVIPLFPSEVVFKSKRKAEDLLALWKAAGVPFWDPERSSVPV
jgi:hypothetical protein